ncbi:MAG TPA: glycosyltransferase [Candidatus Limnocylindrales bacterium]|nr:glycosyltransferase [Candidatus Limnocylindrales bacterium]
MATRIIVFARFMKNRLCEEFPELKDKIAIIPHTVKLERRIHDFSDKLKLTGEEFIFLVPAGIRPVKNVTFCLRPLARLREKYPCLRLVYAGPILDEEYGTQFLEAIKGLDWVIYLGAVPHENMYSLLNLADVVINSSISEGMPNAILEAMSLGKAVLVSKIPGNEALVTDGREGFTFSSESEFYSKAERLIREEDLRKKLGARAKKKVILNFSNRREIEDHLQVYKQAMEAYFPKNRRSETCCSRL